MNNNYETIDAMLEKKYGKKKVIKSSKAPKIKKIKTKKSKKFIVSMVALITAGVIALSSGIITFVNNKKNKGKDTSKNSTSFSTIDDMGTELEFSQDTTSKYGETTGNVNVDEIVEKDGKLYVDKNSADKSNQVGNSSVDTKNNTLKVESDGTVKDKTPGYEVKDDNKVVSSGNGNIPDGYAWDSVLKKYLPKEEIGKYVYADATYYDSEGNIIINKGDVVAKETLEKAKKYLTTTKPIQSSSSNTTTKPIQSSSSNTTTSSNVSSNISSSSNTTTSTTTSSTNGTYTMFGLTFESKDDYEQWVLQGYEGYVEVDGIMKSEEEIQKQLVK